MLILEFADKTNLIALSLMSSTKKPMIVAIGGLIGIVIITIIAVLIGSILGEVIPIKIVKLISSLVFIFLGVRGIMEYLENQEEEMVEVDVTPDLSTIAILKMSIILVGFAEIGDKSQISVLTGSTLYNPFAIFLGAILGMGVIMGITALVGKALIEKVPEEKLHLLGSIFFIIAGIVIFIEAIIS